MNDFASSIINRRKHLVVGLMPFYHILLYLYLIIVK